MGARGDSREVALLLFFGTGDHDRPRRQSREEQHQTEHVGVLRDLFNRERETHDPGARAAVLLRNAEAEEIGLSELVEEVLGVLSRRIGNKFEVVENGPRRSSLFAATRVPAGL